MSYVGLIGTFGLTEILLISGIVMLLFGSSQIPKLARSIGSSVKEFKKAKEEVEQDLFAGESGEAEKKEKKA